MSTPTILLTNYYPETALTTIRQELPGGFTLLSLPQPGREAVQAQIAQADYLLAGGHVALDAEMLDAAVRLKMVQRTGVGLNHVDLKALETRGIPLYVNSGVNAHSVAEHTLALMLATLRQLPLADKALKTGQWPRYTLGISNQELRGKTIGLIGLGHIGQAVARCLSGFSVHVIYNTPHRVPVDLEQELKCHYSPFDELLSTADIISLHCPFDVTKKNWLLGETEIRKMKPGVIFINTARGQLVDPQALFKALQEGHIRGAGLDVFEKEPLPTEHPLTTLDNVVLTPHIAGLSRETFRHMMRCAFQNIQDFEHKRHLQPSSGGP